MRRILLVFLLAGCATAQPETARERTINEQILAFDASKTAGGDPACRDRKIVGSEIARPFQAGNQLPAGQWTERWTVDRCGSPFVYYVHYIRAPDGHLGVTILREPGLESAAIAGGTIADRVLQRDAIVLLTQKDLSETEGQPCRTRRVTNTEVVNPVSGGQVENGRPIAGTWVERWTLDRCGAPVNYLLRFSTSRTGTSFSAERE